MSAGRARILFVSGKGGTGKSFVAEALARAAASRGLEVALVRVRGQAADADGVAGRATHGDAAGARLGGTAASRLEEVVFDERLTLEKFLVRVLRLGFVARRLLDSRTFSAVAAATPGLRDLVTLTAITALASPSRRPRLDLIVVDAPATGHSVPLLTAPTRVLDIAPLGPVAREARAARRLVADHTRFLPLIVTTPEELAVTEALTLYDDLLRAGVPAPRIAVNGLWPEHLEPRFADWLTASAASSDALLHWKRRRRQLDLIAMLEGRVGPCAALPFSFQEGAVPEAEIGALLNTLLEGRDEGRAGWSG